MHSAPPADTADHAKYLIGIWLILIASMLGSWFSLGLDSPAEMTAVLIALALLKVVLVVGCYMEVAGAPLWLKALCGAWVLIVFSLVAVFHAAPAWVQAMTGN